MQCWRVSCRCAFWHCSQRPWHTMLGYSLLWLDGKICSFAGSALVTLLGFSILKYAECTEDLSKQVGKELEVRAARYYSRLMILRKQRAPRSENSGGYSAHVQKGIRFKRNFKRMPLRLEVKPFGTVKTGHSVDWIQQIIENTVSAIFMVTVPDCCRMLF